MADEFTGRHMGVCVGTEVRCAAQMVDVDVFLISSQVCDEVCTLLDAGFASIPAMIAMGPSLFHCRITL